MKSYKKLMMWEKSNLLVLEVYRVTNGYPRSEVYGLTSQLRRACLSVVLNIVEGYARSSSKEFGRFLNISFGSLAEVEYLLELSVKLGYISEEAYTEMEEIRMECGKMIWSYRSKIRRNDEY